MRITNRYLAAQLLKAGCADAAIAAALECPVSSVSALRELLAEKRRDKHVQDEDIPNLDTPRGTRVEEMVELGMENAARRGTIMGKWGEKLIIRFDGEDGNRHFYPECLWLLEED